MFWESDSKRKFPVPANRIKSIFSSAKCFRTKFRKFASIFVLWNGILRCFPFTEWGETEFREFASVWQCYVQIFHHTPTGYTVDRKTRRKRNMSCYGLLSAVSNPSSPPCHPSLPHIARHLHPPVAVLSGLEGRGRAPLPPPPPPKPLPQCPILRLQGENRGRSLIRRSWV